MSLNTLLEAARYLEIQEQRQIQQLHQLEELQKTTIDIISPTISCSPSLSTPNCPQRSISTTPSLPTLSLRNVEVAESGNVVHQNGNTSRIIHNSFDIINPLVIDEGGEPKRKQPPLVFRAGTREVHNKLEKNRRAHLKECFDLLKRQLPAQTEEKKTSNLSILHSALRYIQILRRKERDLEHEMERLAREKISAQQKLAILKKDVTAHCDNSTDLGALLVESNHQAVDCSESVSTLVNSPRISTEIVSITKLSDDIHGDSINTNINNNNNSIERFGKVNIGKYSIGGENIVINERISCFPHSKERQSILTPEKTQVTTSSLTAVMTPISGVEKLLCSSIQSLSENNANSHHQQQQQQQCSSVVPSQMQTSIQSQQQSLQGTAALSVLPVTGYPPGLVLHKVALVPKGIADLTPLAAVSSPVAHFITTSQQLNGKVLPLVNAQYVVKPVVVMTSSPSVTPRSSS